MIKIKWGNIVKLLVMVITFMLSIVCIVKATNNSVLNYLLISICLNFIWLGIGYDIVKQVRG